MNIEDIIHNALVAQRAEEMKASAQLTLGELILKLEAIEDKEKPVIFNAQYHPTDLDSWRGSYEELAIEYAELGEPLIASEFLQHLKLAVGEIFIGYKGGEYRMGKTTPVWVANYGQSYGFRVEGDITTQAVVDVSQDETSVILVTQNIEY